MPRPLAAAIWKYALTKARNLDVRLVTKPSNAFVPSIDSMLMAGTRIFLAQSVTLLGLRGNPTLPVHFLQGTRDYDGFSQAGID